MWTQQGLSITRVWDLAIWTVTATWQEDPTSEPVVLVRSGQERIHPYASPGEVLDVVSTALAFLGAQGAPSPKG